MKKFLFISAGPIACATLLLAASSAMAANVDISIGVPGVYAQPQPVYVQPQPVYVQPRTVYVQPRPVYVQPQYENDWRERQVRAAEWRDNPRNHGQVVSASAHERNDERKHEKERHKEDKHHGHDRHDD
jgi:hypothetical protein